jgi:hypothetical protein
MKIEFKQSLFLNDIRSHFDKVFFVWKRLVELNKNKTTILFIDEDENELKKLTSNSKLI